MGESLRGATGPSAQTKSVACPVNGRQRNPRLFPPSCSVDLAMGPHGALWEVFLKGSEGQLPFSDMRAQAPWPTDSSLSWTA